MRGIAASRGCEEGIGIVDEFGVRRGLSKRAGVEEEERDCQERGGEHGDGWLEKEGRLEDYWGTTVLKNRPGEINSQRCHKMQARPFQKKANATIILRQIYMQGGNYLSAMRQRCGN